MDAVTRPVHPPVVLSRRLARLALWIAASICVFGTISIAAGSALSVGPPADEATPSAFAGRAFPVRPIEYDRASESGSPLVRVPCGCRAKATSLCWVARP